MFVFLVEEECLEAVQAALNCLNCLFEEEDALEDAFFWRREERGRTERKDRTNSIRFFRWNNQNTFQGAIGKQ